MIDAAFISSVGFPIGVATYLLFRFERKLDENTKAISNLTIFLNGNIKKRR